MTTQPEPILNDAEAEVSRRPHPKTIQRMARRGEIPHYRALSYVVRGEPFLAVEKGGCVRYRADGILSLSRLF
jgi:hypothetical protein